ETSSLEQILRLELRRNHAFPNRDHLLLAQRILESNQARDELLGIAQRDQPLISENRIGHLKGEFLSLTRRDWSVGLDFELTNIVRGAGFALLVGPAIDEGRHRHDVLLHGDRTVMSILDTNLHYQRIGAIVKGCTFGMNLSHTLTR